MFRYLAGVLCASFLVAAPAGTMAQPVSHPPGGHATQPTPSSSRPGDHRPGDNRPGDHRPGPSGPSYGNWQNGWGPRPPAPPSHWTRQGDWYRHVRACQRHYRSYDPRTDTYRTRGGKRLRCRL